MKFKNFKNELAGLPAEIRLGRSNAFPWVITYKNKLYLTFRSASVHMPIIGSRAVVISKLNNAQFGLEVNIKVDRDIRESRLVEFKDKILLYFSTRNKINPFSNDSIFVCKNWKKAGLQPKKFINVVLQHIRLRKSEMFYI